MLQRIAVGGHQHQSGRSFVGIQLKVLGYRYTRFSGSNGAFPRFYCSLFGIGTSNVECQLSVLVTYHLGAERLSVLLVGTVDLWQIMIARLHGPYLVATVAEGLGGIFAHTRINEQWFAFYINYERAHVVVIVALAVVSALKGCKMAATARSHNL